MESIKNVWHNVLEIFDALEESTESTEVSQVKIDAEFLVK